MAYAFFLAGTQFPIPPESIKTKINSKNETITLINEGEVNLIKSPGLSDISFDLLLPMFKYPFAVYPNGFHDAHWYLELLEYLKVSEQPFQLDIYREYPTGEQTYHTNVTVTLEDYEIYEGTDNGFDIVVSVELKTYTYFGVKILTLSDDGKTYMIERYDAKSNTRVTEVKDGEDLYDVCMREFGYCDEELMEQIYQMNKNSITAVNADDVSSVITDSDVWDDGAWTTKANAVALVCKAIGGVDTTIDSSGASHWVYQYVMTLYNKGIITDIDFWMNNPDAYISSAHLLALADNMSGGIVEAYQGRETDHWGRNHLDSLCDKCIIFTPEAWTEFESVVINANTKQLINNALEVIGQTYRVQIGTKLIVRE